MFFDALEANERQKKSAKIRAIDELSRASIVRDSRHCLSGSSFIGPFDEIG